MKFCIAITFFCRTHRFKYLKQVLEAISDYNFAKDVWIVSNVSLDEIILSCPDEYQGFFQSLPSYVQVFHAKELPHPLLLTWAHYVIFREQIANGTYTHFMYLEDDLLITQRNISYWIDAFRELSPLGLLPSFVRYEVDQEGEKFSSDIRHRMPVGVLPRFTTLSGRSFVNLAYPYQATYLLDRNLMAGHLGSISSSPDFGRWHISEKAAQGLTFFNVPKGFTSRNVVEYDPATRLFLPDR